jgi:hypothetical protein
MLGEESIKDKDSLKSPMPLSIGARKNLSTQRPELDIKHKKNELDPIYKVNREDYLHEADSDEDTVIKKTVKVSETDSLRTSNENLDGKLSSSEESHKRLMDEINASDYSEEPVVRL